MGSRFRHCHLENALRYVGLDRIGVDALRQLEGTLERAIAALDEPIVFVLLFFFGLFLTTDREQVVGQIDLDVLLFEARQFGGDFDLLVRLGHIDARHQRCRTGVGKRRKTSREIIEKSIDLTLQRHERIGRNDHGQSG